MLRMQRAQPSYGTFAAPNSRRLTGMQGWMTFWHEPELRCFTGEIEQRCDIGFHIEEIDLRRFDTPLLRQRSARDDARDHFRLRTISAAVTTTDLEQSNALLLPTLIAAECLQQAGPQRCAHHGQLCRN